jgi:hypothetical protein
MSYGFCVGLKFLDSLPVGFDMVGVDFVLRGCWIERAELQEDLYCSLVFGDGDSLGAFSLEIYGFIGVFDCESF